MPAAIMAGICVTISLITRVDNITNTVSLFLSFFLLHSHAYINL